MTPYGSLRTHGAGTLRGSDAGADVILAGWVARRRDHGGVAFLDLRDRSGVVQVVADPNAGAALQVAHDVRNEYVIRIHGRVRMRPGGMENPDLQTGAVEVAAERLEILSGARTPPFPITERTEADEATRLKYRYLDIRRPAVTRALRLRSEIAGIIREVMTAHGFLEVETPMLTRSTPEGARDFLVPSRMRPGASYALPQSPQLFKQLLMVAGLERYFQIVRCFRDEDLRADRQPEFTQLDIEASFIDEEDIYALIEELMAKLWRRVVGVELELPFPRLAWHEAMARFGSDSPDLRFAMELGDVSDIFTDTDVGVFAGALAAGGAVVALCLPGGGELSRKQFDDWVGFARARGARGLAWAIVEETGLRSPLAKFMSEAETSELVGALGARPGDALFLAAGPVVKTQELMGALRIALAEARDLIDTGRWDFAWITDWPLFEWNEDEQRWDSPHHPFTAPQAKWEERFEQAPGEALSRAYDLTLNGVELGGGSIRIHRPELQERMFHLLGIEQDEANERFGFLLEGLSYGAPPHGGIAFGLDRMVMLAIGGESLRDVIAFPKTQTGTDPLTGAPSPVDDSQLRELGLRALPQV